MLHTTSTATVTTRPDPRPDATPGRPDRADAGAAASSLQNPPPPHHCPMPVDEVTRRLAELAELVDAATAWQTARLTARVDQLTAELDAERAARRAAEHTASHDQLTGLPNRGSLQAGWTSTITGVIMVDVDDFKTINDTYGHDVGDQVLTTVAWRLAGLPDLTAHRVGGDEYVLTTHLPERLHDGLLTAVRDACSTPVATPHGRVPVTVSVGGAAIIPDDTLTTALRRADLAMYHAKRGQPLWWSPDLDHPPTHPRRRVVRDHQEQTR